MTEYRIYVTLRCIVKQEAANPGEALYLLAESGDATLGRPMYNVDRELKVVGKEGEIDEDTGEYHISVGVNGKP